MTASLPGERGKISNCRRSVSVDSWPSLPVAAAPLTRCSAARCCYSRCWHESRRYVRRAVDAVQALTEHESLNAEQTELDDEVTVLTMERDALAADVSTLKTQIGDIEQRGRA
jgi:hypothetical protein